MDRAKLISDIVEFAQASVSSFLQENAGLVFYAFAFDCNAEYASVGLSLNTEDDFKKSIDYYQSTAHGEYYKTPEGIYEIRYNPGDWEYVCFETFEPVTEDELAAVYGRDMDRQVDEFMDIFTHALVEFSKTAEYEKIPKTADFKVICIDHDEDLADAEERLNKIRR